MVCAVVLGLLGIHNFQRHDFRFQFTVCQMESTHTHWQLEAPWPGAAWIEVKYPVLQFLLGNVTVPVDDRCEFCRFRFQIEFLKAVQHVDRYFADLENVRSWNFLRPRAVINVPAYGC